MPSYPELEFTPVAPSNGSAQSDRPVVPPGGPIRMSTEELLGNHPSPPKKLSTEEELLGVHPAPPRRSNDRPPPRPNTDNDAALAAAMQAEEEALARSHPPPPHPPPSHPPPSHGPPSHPPPAHIHINRWSSDSNFNLVAKRPYFGYVVVALNVLVFLWEIERNGWGIQPLSCPMSCAGLPCYEDGSPCESNPLLGPRVSTLDAMGAKNDVRIFEQGEYWRIVSCNWMHAGLLHLIFNMAAVWRIGFDLERVFGPLRVGALYIFSGLFGTVLSTLLLPGSLSVGASASVFGLLGANWADVIVNFCAHCTLRNSGVVTLGFATIFNVAIGFTPWVDNFMHLGGMLAGILVGIASFAQAKRHRETGIKAHTRSQVLVMRSAVSLQLAIAVILVAALFSPDLRRQFHSCTACSHFNCISAPWWSCCATSLQGSCNFNAPLSDTAPISVFCNISGAPPFTGTCSPLDGEEACAWEPNDPAKLRSLCALVCSGCTG